MPWFWLGLYLQVCFWQAGRAPLVVGGLLLAGALLCCWRAAARPTAAVGLCAGLMSLQAILTLLCEQLALRCPELPLGWLVAAPLALVGVDAAGAGPAVWVAGAVTTTRPDNLLLTGLLMLAFCGGGGLWCSSRQRPTTHLAWLAGLALFAPLRLGVALALDLPAVWWIDCLWLLVPLLPLVLLDRGKPAPVLPRRGSRPAARLSACGALLLLLAVVAPDPGRTKPGRILIDEGHSRWEPVEVPLDTRRYGLATVYTFHALRQSLRRHFRQAEVIRAPLTSDRLSGCDVLILKTPTRSYRPEEVAAVVRFVEQGGGLWLVGEHTNVFGSSTYLNQVATRFGIRFRPDAALAPSGGRPAQRRPAWLAHPAVARMPPLPDAISCSLGLSGAARAALVGRGLVSADPDYSANNFFGPFADRPHLLRGPLVRMATTTRGRGRVAAFTDSTLLSSFSYHLPGAKRLTLGTVDWLNRRSSPGWIRPAGVLLGLLLLGLGLVRGPCPRTGMAWGWTGLLLVLLAHRSMLHLWYRPIAPHAPGTRVAFLRTGGFDLSLTPVPPERANLLSLVVATQRLGLVPRIVDRLEDGLTAEGLVIANPSGPPDVARLRAYLKRGGRLLILLDRAAPWVDRLRGAGRLVVIGPPHRLDDRHLGGTGAPSTPARRARYEAFYDAMRSQLQLGR